jgi:hypothetical protein
MLPGSIIVGTYVWSPSNPDDFYADDVDEGNVPATCYTCGQKIPLDAPAWYCDDNGEEVCDGCEIPYWDD